MSTSDGLVRPTVDLIADASDAMSWSADLLDILLARAQRGELEGRIVIEDGLFGLSDKLHDLLEKVRYLLRETWDEARTLDGSG